MEQEEEGEDVDVEEVEEVEGEVGDEEEVAVEDGDNCNIHINLSIILYQSVKSSVHAIVFNLLNALLVQSLDATINTKL